MIRTEDVFKIGRLGKPHGVKGEITFLFTDDVFDRVEADYLVVMIDGILVPFFMEEYRFKTDETALVKFEDIDTQDAARALTNCEVFFPRQLADTDEQAISLNQLVGFLLKDIHNGDVGEIYAVDDTTQNLLFEVKMPNGKELLVPASEEFIRDINAKTRTITVELPDGLLNLV